MSRHDGRAQDALRNVQITPNFTDNPLGSVLIQMGNTRVMCTACAEDRLPQFLLGSGEGWVTAEYSMLPGSTDRRMQREASRGRLSGRTMEIQRLIGRALRSVIDRTALGERTMWVDCDVIQADGGTRTASITGGFIALCLGLHELRRRKLLKRPVVTGMVAAISVGVVQGQPALDLDYVEDSAAEVDMNIVRTEGGKYVELQGTAETTPFGREHLDEMLRLGDKGIDELIGRQREVLAEALDGLVVRPDAKP
jgi:ribonuclease PH